MTNKRRLRRMALLSGATLAVLGAIWFGTEMLPAGDGPTPIPSGATFSIPKPPMMDDSSLPTSYPDKFAWMLFVKVNQKSASQMQVGPGGALTTNNATWESWPDDPHTFPQVPNPNQPPTWPETAKVGKRLVRGAAEKFHNLKRTEKPGGVDVPDSGGEEVHRNRATFDFIIRNNLWYQQGVAAAFAKAAKAVTTEEQTATAITFPIDSIEVKGNWVKIQEKDKPNYHWNYTADGTLLGLVAMHISSKALPNWFWCTFEWQNNPGRCDYIGCHDCFGVEPNHVPSHPNTANKTYPPGTLTKDLLALFDKNGFVGDWGAQWKNYRLKGSQIDFASQTGHPLLLGNSVTENGFVPTASCITCHSRAAVTSSGVSSFPTFGEKVGLPIADANEAFTYNGEPDPNWYYKFDGNGSQLLNLPVDFVWAIPFHAQPVPNATPPGK